MELVKGMKLQSGDDMSITINVDTSCVPYDLSQYNAYWELHRTMGDDALLNKTSAGGMIITVDSILTYGLNTSTYTLTITPSAAFITLLNSNSNILTQFQNQMTNVFTIVTGMNTTTSWNGPGNVETFSNGSTTATLTYSTGYTQFTYVYNSTLAANFNNVVSAIEGGLIAYADVASGNIPNLVYTNNTCSVLTITNNQSTCTISSSIGSSLTSYISSYSSFMTEFLQLSIGTFGAAVGAPAVISFPQSGVYVVTGPNGSLTITVTGTLSAPTAVTIVYSSGLSNIVGGLMAPAMGLHYALINSAMSLTPFPSYSFPSTLLPGYIFMDTVNNAVVIYLDQNETSVLYGQYYQYLYLLNQANGNKTSLAYGPVLFLESPNTVYPTVTYCTPEDVSAQLELINQDGSPLVFTELTNPSRGTVIDYILDAQSVIDNTTKNSWQMNYVVNEYHDIKPPLSNMPRRDLVISLSYSHIFPIDPTQGDAINFYTNGTAYNYASEAMQVDGTSWWVDYNVGQIHINDMWPWFNTGKCRIQATYRWGDVPVPNDIHQVCTQMTAIRLLTKGFNKIFIMNQKPALEWDKIIEKWEEKHEKILSNHTRKMFSFCMR